MENKLNLKDRIIRSIMISLPIFTISIAGCVTDYASRLRKETPLERSIRQRNLLEPDRIYDSPPMVKPRDNNSRLAYNSSQDYFKITYQ